MRIAIAARYRPYSHNPGTSCLLPKSCWVVQAYPTLLRLMKNGEAPIEIPLPFTGPVREFTLQQDLEKGCVWVWGVAKEGRFRLCLKVEAGKLCFDGKEFTLSGPFRETPGLVERLSFGSHKAQEWGAVSRRADPVEILPVLFALSQWTPVIESQPTAVFDLLERLDEPFLRAAFSGILSPQLVDDEHQGILPKETIPRGADALALVALAGAKIRKSLLEQRGNSLILHPPKHLSGRMVHAKLEGVGLLDFEWRQGRIRRAILHAYVDTRVSMEKIFRLRTAEHERGKRTEGEFEVKNGSVYFLDRFEK